MSKSMKALLTGLPKFGELPQDYSGLIPNGEYRSLINKVEVKTSAAGHDYLSVWHKLAGNESYDNSIVFNRFSIGSTYPEKTQKMALGQLKSLIRSAGIEVADDEEIGPKVADLEGLVSRIYVTRRDGQNGYEPENNISRYVIPTATPF